MTFKNYLIALTILLYCSFSTKAQTAADYGIQLEALVQTAPPKISLNWKKISGTTQYNIQRKTKFASFWTTLGTTVDTFYTDLSVVSDSAYEYKVFNTGGIAAAAGYIYAGINAPAIHNRGTLILVVDTLFRDSCAVEINNLMKDLSADGWAIVRFNAPRSTPDSIIRKQIKQYYASLPDVQSVLILGHIAVPYSGELNPDAHPDHLGAWPADMFYGEMNDVWTDAIVNNATSASRAQNKNIPGDGKWDQTIPPSAIELQVSRIDFANMPLFAKSEVNMMKNYLYKAHKYKMDSLYVSRKALVDDNFGAFSGEAFAANAWRNFPQLIGRENIKAADFMTTLNDSAYQWAFGCGGGSYSSCGGVGTTTDFTTKKQKGIFTVLFGSYFGDWDSQNNFLRAPLCCSEPALSSCWAGRPNWFFHHMALGENIGYSALITQNNIGGTYTPLGYMYGAVHIALMGDLSLRSDYIKPAKNISISPIAKKGATITWTASTDPTVIGYYVYRADSLYGKYTKLSGLIAGTTFKDTVGKDGLKFYMVRPSKLQSTPSGTYYNLGLGIADSATVSYPIPTSMATLKDAVIHLICFPNPTNEILNIYGHLNTNKGILTIRIVDILGKVQVQSTQEIKQNEFTVSENIGNLSAGNYFVQVSLNNKMMGVQKISKL
jgi:hypothetical protein